MLFDPPNIPIQISANPEMSDFCNKLEHPITIEGIEIADSQTSANDIPKIVITRTLTNNLQSECLFSTCICSILVMTLVLGFLLM